MCHKKILMLSFILSLTLELLVAGCGQRKLEREVITLAFWDDSFNRSFAQRVVDYYNSYEMPAIPVKFIDLGSGKNYYSKLLTMVAGGTPPDVMLLMPDEMVDFAARNTLLDFTPFAVNDPEFAKIKDSSWPYLWQSGKFKGKDFGMPIWTNSIGLFYNKTLFDKERLAYPDNTWRWEEFLTAAKRLTKDTNQDGRMEQFGFGGIPLSLDAPYLYLYIRQNGGDLFNEDRTKCLLGQPEAVEAVQWVIDLMTKHHVTPTQEEISSGQFYTGGNSLLLSGRVAMIWGGRWIMPELSQAKDLEWGVAPLFHGKKKVAFSATALLSVSIKTKYPYECWKFLKFMMNEEGQKLIISDRSEIPILKSLARSTEYLNRFLRPKENEVFVKELEYSEPYPYVVGQKPWMDEAKIQLEKALLGELSVKKACELISQRYTELVHEGKIKP